MTEKKSTMIQSQLNIVWNETNFYNWEANNSTIHGVLHCELIFGLISYQVSIFKKSPN